MAVAVAVALSPLAPLGSFHRLEPAPGISSDPAVLGAGAALFLIAATAAAVVLARGEVRTLPRGPGVDDWRWAKFSARLSLPTAARAGIGFAFEPDPGGYSRPAGPGILGTVAALGLLARDPDIAAWAGGYFDSVEINGHNIPVLAAGHRPHLLPAGPLSRVQPATLAVPHDAGIPRHTPAVTRHNSRPLKIF